MAYAYNVHIARREPYSRQLAPAEPIGRIAAHNIHDALQEAEERHRNLIMPWQGLAVRRLYFDATGLKIRRRGDWHYLHPLED